MCTIKQLQQLRKLSDDLDYVAMLSLGQCVDELISVNDALKGAIADIEAGVKPACGSVDGLILCAAIDIKKAYNKVVSAL